MDLSSYMSVDVGTKFYVPVARNWRLLTEWLSKLPGTDVCEIYLISIERFNYWLSRIGIFRSECVISAVYGDYIQFILRSIPKESFWRSSQPTIAKFYQQDYFCSQQQILLNMGGMGSSFNHAQIRCANLVNA